MGPFLFIVVMWAIWCGIRWTRRISRKRIDSEPENGWWN